MPGGQRRLNESWKTTLGSTYLPLSCQSSMPLRTLCLFNKTHKNFSPLVHLLLPNIPDLPPHVPLIKCPSFTFPRPFPQNVHFYSPPLCSLFVPESCLCPSRPHPSPLTSLFLTYLPHISLISLCTSAYPSCPSLTYSFFPCIPLPVP